MARETKLGMLVGLGFIICFAIILENRGRSDRVAPQMPHELLAQSNPVAEPGTPQVNKPAVTERSRRAQPPDRAGTGTDRGHRPGSSSRRPGPSGTSSVDSQGTTRLATEGPATASVPGHDSAGAQPVEPTPMPSGSPDGGDSFHAAATTPAPNERAPMTVEASPPGPGSEPSAPRASLTATTSSLPAPTELTATHRPTQPVTVERPVRRCTVQPGDSLTRIASRNYGSGSKRVVNAIFDANRAQLSSPDQLRVGMELVLPEVEGLAKPGPEAPPEAAPQQDTPKRGDEGPYRYYQIQKGDRYATIARDLLGDVDRWRELAELNKDIFPDPAKIRCGVRIRLPADARADRTEGRL